MLSKVNVCIRFRPLNNRERDLGDSEVWRVEQGSIKHVEKDQHFSFDHVFDSEASSEQVFTALGAPIVDSVLHGANGTIFACSFLNVVGIGPHFWYHFQTVKPAVARRSR